MQLPPLTSTDIILLLTVDSILLLLISEFASSYGLKNLTLNKKRLKNVAITTGLLFFVTVAIRIIGLMAYP